MNEVSAPLNAGLAEKNSVYFVSLGCPKNLVDSQVMLGTLRNDRYRITETAAEAEVIIVNTCSFIDSAQEESVDTILESVELRDANRRGQAVIVSGCLSQRFRDELPKLMPEVDAFMGIDQVAQVGDIVGKAIANRAEKIENQHSASNRQRSISKSKVVGRLPAILSKLNNLPDLSMVAFA